MVIWSAENLVVTSAFGRDSGLETRSECQAYTTVTYYAIIRICVKFTFTAVLACSYCLYIARSSPFSQIRSHIYILYIYIYYMYVYIIIYIYIYIYIYINKEELKMVVRDILACAQPNCHKTFTALWNPYRRVSSRGQCVQIRYS